jgi:hypothetical protein
MVVIYQRNSSPDVMAMIKTFESTAVKLKAAISINKLEVAMREERDLVSALQTAYQKYDKANMFVFVIPSSLKNSYSRIKRLALG